MAVHSGAFSIREYAVNMRSVDMAKSWPFDGEPVLPPMVVKKFHLWSKEVEKWKAKAKGKEKGPKKRSIADIFKVAPHVEREDVDEDYVDDEEGEDEGVNFRVLALCDVENKIEILGKTKTQRSECIKGKEIPQSSMCMGSVVNTSYVVPMLKKKRSKLTYLATRKKQKPIEASKSTEHRESDFTVGSDAMIRDQKFGMIAVDDQDSSSDTDKAIESRGKALNSLDYATFQNIVAPCSYAKNYSLDTGKVLATNEISDSEESLQCESQVQFASRMKKIDAFCHPDLPNLMRPEIGFERYFSDRLLIGNQVVPRSEDISSYASSSVLLPLRKEVDDSNTNFADLSRDTTTSFPEYIDAFSGPSMPSMATYGEAQGKLPFSSHNGKVVNYANQAQQHQLFPYLSPAELLRSIIPFSDLKQRPVLGDVRYTDKGFCGLPLNSQGELIQLNSSASGHGMFNPPMKTTSEATYSFASLPLHNLQTSSTIDLSCFKENNIHGGSKADKLFKSSPNQDFVSEKSSVPLFSELPSSGRKEENYFDFFRENTRSYNQHSPMEIMHLTQFGQNRYYQVQDQIGDRKTSDHVPLKSVSQPTMRLMGKEFTVGKGKDDSQSSEDGNIWTDKRIITEHHATASSAFYTSSSLAHQFQQGMSLENTPIFTNKTRTAQPSQSFLQVNVDGSRLSYPLPTDKIYPQFHPLMSRDHSPQLHPYFPSNFPPQFSIEEPFVYRYEYDSTPQVNRSSTIANKQKHHILSHPTRPFEFPFLPPVCGEDLSCSGRLPPWLLSENKRKETPATSFTSYFDAGDRFPLSRVSGTNFAHPPPVAPLNSESMPTSLMNNIHGYTIIPRVGAKDLDKGKANKKRRSNEWNESVRRTKMPHLNVQDCGGNKMPRPTTVSSELNLMREKMSYMNGGFPSLGPGKHVLKHGPNVNGDYSRSTQDSELKWKLTPIFSGSKTSIFEPALGHEA